MGLKLGARSHSHIVEMLQQHLTLHNGGTPQQRCHTPEQKIMLFAHPSVKTAQSVRIHLCSNAGAQR